MAMGNDLKEKYILVGIAERDEEEAYSSLDELADLLDTAGGEALFQFIQKRQHPDPATYIGKGKADELRELIDMHEADGIVCDDELSPSQIRNLTQILDTKVIDRTILILDIFAAHAMTREGKLQVEMAQLKYRLSHLQGLGVSLSRQGGGIGTRGPGETKLETDRRRVKSRIASLNKEIRHLGQMRENTRKRRINGTTPIAAIIGYTNAGKSTLLNRLTEAEVYADDKLFATLDPTTRKCRFPDGTQFLLTDTVGFINKLPHNLIDAFRSTLEEAGFADILIHVVDASDPERDMHIRIVYDTLRELGIEGKPIVTVFNKTDKLPADHDEKLYDERANIGVLTSVKNGTGLDQLFKALADLKESMNLYEN